MLSYTPMKNLAGIRLEGDYGTLVALHQTIHKISDGSRMGEKQNDILLALAYDVRKAYEEMRDVIQPPKNNPQIGVRYGVKIIWPILLIQARLLREGLAWGPSTSADQACTYDLEAVIESALADQFPKTDRKIRNIVANLNTSFDALIEKIDPLSGMFCSWDKKTRKERLHLMMTAFDPLHETVSEIYLKAGHDVITPEAIAAWRNREWVDPETGR